MVQKKIKYESQSVQESPLSAFFRNLKDTLVNNLVSNLKENIREKVIRMEKKVFHGVTAYLLFILGMIFVAVAIALLLQQYLLFSYGWGFLIAGGVLFVLALIFKHLAKKI